MKVSEKLDATFFLEELKMSSTNLYQDLFDLLKSNKSEILIDGTKSPSEHYLRIYNKALMFALHVNQALIAKSLVIENGEYLIIDVTGLANAVSNILFQQDMDSNKRIIANHLEIISFYINLSKCKLIDLNKAKNLEKKSFN